MESDPVRAASRALTEAEDAHLNAYPQYVEARRVHEVISLEGMLDTEIDPKYAGKLDGARAAMTTACDKERAAR